MTHAGGWARACPSHTGHSCAPHAHPSHGMDEELVDARLSAYLAGVDEMERVQNLIVRLQEKYREFAAVVSLKSAEVQNLDNEIMARKDQLHTMSQESHRVKNEKTQHESQLRELRLAVATEQRELKRISKAISAERIEHSNTVAQEKLAMAEMERERKDVEVALEKLRRQRLEEELKLRLYEDKESLRVAEFAHLEWEVSEREKKIRLNEEKIKAFDDLLEKQQADLCQKVAMVTKDRESELGALRSLQKTDGDVARNPSEPDPHNGSNTKNCRQCNELRNCNQCNELNGRTSGVNRPRGVGNPLDALRSELDKIRQRGGVDIRLSLDTASFLFDSIVAANTQLDMMNQAERDMQSCESWKPTQERAYRTRTRS